MSFSELADESRFDPSSAVVEMELGKDESKVGVTFASVVSVAVVGSEDGTAVVDCSIVAPIVVPTVISVVVDVVYVG